MVLRQEQRNVAAARLIRPIENLIDELCKAEVQHRPNQSGAVDSDD
jgi:hypothetical protein